jgi:hypothetical protein
MKSKRFKPMTSDQALTFAKQIGAITDDIYEMVNAMILRHEAASPSRERDTSPEKSSAPDRDQ